MSLSSGIVLLHLEGQLIMLAKVIRLEYAGKFNLFGLVSQQSCRYLRWLWKPRHLKLLELLWHLDLLKQLLQVLRLQSL